MGSVGGWVGVTAGSLEGGNVGDGVDGEEDLEEEETFTAARTIATAIIAAPPSKAGMTCFFAGLVAGG